MRSVKHTVMRRERCGSRCPGIDRIARAAGKRPSRRPARSAFTLFDLFITMAAMVLVAAIVLPGSSIGSNAQTRLLAAATILASDLEFAQVHNITHPDDPVVVRFMPAERRYWVAFADDTETPMPRPDTGEPYEMRFGIGRAAAAAGAQISLANVPAESIRFNAQGGIDGVVNSPVITLEFSPRWHSLTINPVTGSIIDADGSG